MNTPILETKRLILRKFNQNDIKAIYRLYSDKEVNTFLPRFPFKTRFDAYHYYLELKEKYKQPQGYIYAVCLKEEDTPIGEIHVAVDDSYDFGYALLKEYWHQGITSEASQVVIEQLKKDGIPYITATHDIHNPRSGHVMLLFCRLF